MKRSTIFSLIIILPHFVFSQYYGEINIGIAASKMTIPKKIEVINNAVFNPTIQGSIVRILGPKFSGVLSVQFVGYGFAADETDKSPSAAFRLHYALIIPKVEYRISSKFTATAGISFGKLISTERKSGNDRWKNVDEFNFFEDFELGITSGLQYNVGNFILGISYFHGLRNIANAGDGWTDLNHVVIDNPIAHNRSLSFGVSYRFKL